MLSKVLKRGWGQGPKKWSKNCIKRPKNAKSGALGIRHGRARNGTAVPPHARPCVYPTHGRAWGARLAVRPGTAGRAWVGPFRGLLPRVHGRAPLRHARARPVFGWFAVLWCSGRPRTSNLPWSYIWSPLFHQNPKISPEMKTNAI